MLVRNGVAVLAYDKRGIGQSGGQYPGESPTEDTIDVLARDAAAAARFLAAQPEIDPARVGLAGHSQAGWIMPLAHTREPALHELIGPAVTADEVDLDQDLAGSGDRPQTLADAEIDEQVLRAMAQAAWIPSPGSANSRSRRSGSTADSTRSFPTACPSDASNRSRTSSAVTS